MAGKARSLLKRIPTLEALRAFMEQWGIWKWVVTSASLLTAGALAVLAFLSTLPIWAAGLVGLSALTLATALLFYGSGAWLRFRSLSQVRMDPIDRETLAVEAEKLAHRMGRLLGDHAHRQTLARTKDQAAFMKPARNTNHNKFYNIESAKTLEKFHENYLAEVLKIISMAGKCIPLRRDWFWALSHISDHDLPVVQAALMQIAVDLRHGQPTLPNQEDIQREVTRLAAEQLRQLPPGTGA